MQVNGGVCSITAAEGKTETRKECVLKWLCTAQTTLLYNLISCPRSTIHTIRRASVCVELTSTKAVFYHEPTRIYHSNCCTSLFTPVRVFVLFYNKAWNEIPKPDFSGHFSSAYFFFFSFSSFSPFYIYFVFRVLLHSIQFLNLQFRCCCSSLFILFIFFFSWNVLSPCSFRSFVSFRFIDERALYTARTKRTRPTTDSNTLCIVCTVCALLLLRVYDAIYTSIQYKSRVRSPVVGSFASSKSVESFIIFTL